MQISPPAHFDVWKSGLVNTEGSFKFHNIPGHVRRWSFFAGYIAKIDISVRFLDLNDVKLSLTVPTPPSLL